MSQGGEYNLTLKGWGGGKSVQGLEIKTYTEKEGKRGGGGNMEKTKK